MLPAPPAMPPSCGLHSNPHRVTSAHCSAREHEISTLDQDRRARIKRAINPLCLCLWCRSSNYHSHPEKRRRQTQRNTSPEPSEFSHCNSHSTHISSSRTRFRPYPVSRSRSCAAFDSASSAILRAAQGHAAAIPVEVRHAQQRPWPSETCSINARCRTSGIAAKIVTIVIGDQLPLRSAPQGESERCSVNPLRLSGHGSTQAGEYGTRSTAAVAHTPSPRPTRQRCQPAQTVSSDFVAGSSH